MESFEPPDSPVVQVAHYKSLATVAGDAAMCETQSGSEADDWSDGRFLMEHNST